MESRTEILSELKELSPLLYGIERINVFSVPDGYFDSLDSIILNTVLNEESKFLATISKQNNQQVPEGYFANLADTILAKIKSTEMQSAADELRELSPMLYSIQNENVYSIPAGYFESIADSITDAVLPKAKIISMPQRRSWLRYAVAAVFAGIISIGVFTFINKTGKPTETEVAANIDPYIEKGKTMNEAQFNTALSELSSDEIVNYLETNGDETDIAALTQSIDDNALPSEDDYFIDGETLEKYLKKLDSKPENN